MRPLLLDMGLPRRTADDLQRDGWDVIHVGTAGLFKAADEMIIDIARRQGRTIVTLDEDFARIVAHSGGTGPSVILVRLQGLTHSRATTLIPLVVSSIEEDLDHGCIASVTASGIRVRRLPVR